MNILFQYERAASDQDHLSSEDEFRLGIPKGRSTGQMSVSSEPVTRVTGQVPTGTPSILIYFHNETCTKYIFRIDVPRCLAKCHSNEHVELGTDKFGSAWFRHASTSKGLHP